jgi:hypothetical protein
MPRIVRITKVGKSTIVDVLPNGGTTINQSFVFNKSVNLFLEGNVLNVCTNDTLRLQIAYADIENKLSSTDIRDYLTKAATAFLFCNEG